MTAHERQTLDAFLADLPVDAAAEARAAAARIDEHARIGNAMTGIERRFLPYAAGGAVAFAVGLWLLADRSFGGWWPALCCLAVLPGVAAAYARAVLPRTRADRAAEALNRAHFLPHGGLYFPPGPGEACVVRVEWTPPEPERPLSEAPRDPRKQPIRPGRIW